MIVRYGVAATWSRTEGWLLRPEDIAARSWDLQADEDRARLTPEGFDPHTLSDLVEGDVVIALGWDWVGRSLHDPEQRYVRVPSRDREYVVSSVTPCADQEDRYLLEVVDTEDGEPVRVSGSLPASARLLRRLPVVE